MVEVIQRDRDAAAHFAGPEASWRVALEQAFARHRLQSAPPSQDGLKDSDRAFLRDLAGRIFRNASPSVGFDQGDVDQLYRIASNSPHPTPTTEGEGLDEADRPARMAMFLETLDAVGGQSDASDCSWNWIKAYCHEYEGLEPDTFNSAEQHGFTTVSHDSDTDQSTVYLTEAGRNAIPRLRTQEARPEAVEALEQRLLRAVYDDCPHKAISPALAELTGVPLDEVIPFDAAVEAGWKFDGYLRTIRAVLAALSEQPRTDAAGMRELAKEVADAADDMIRALNDQILTPEQYNKAGERLQKARDRIDQALGEGR